MKVLIIGAGMAGIHATKLLTEYSIQNNKQFDVMILEAKENVGGRTQSIEFGDTLVDIGACWLEGVETNPLVSLCKDFGLWPPIEYDSYENPQYYISGKTVSSTNRIAFKETFGKILQEATKMKFVQDVPMIQAIDEVIAKNKREFNEEERSLLIGRLHSLQGYNGCPLTELSTIFYTEDNGFQGDAVLMEGKLGKFVEMYSKGLNIKCKQIVTKIDYGDKSVIKVTTQDGEIYEADYLICTIPLGCLKKETIEFVPSLPESKQQAIQNIGFGILNKLLLEFDDVFWDPEVTWIDIISDLVNFKGFLCVKDKPVLVAFINTQFGKQIELMDEKEVLERVMIVLKSAFGDKACPPKRSFLTNWWNNPFSYGSYSHYKVGTVPEDFEELGKPIQDRLFFAGEACIVRGSSFVNGAYLAGDRDAKRIISLLNK